MVFAGDGCWRTRWCGVFSSGSGRWVSFGSRQPHPSMCALVGVKSAELRVDRFCDVAAIKCSRVCSAWCLCRAELCMLTREEFHRVKNFTACSCRVLYDGLAVGRHFVPACVGCRVDGAENMIPCSREPSEMWCSAGHGRREQRS